MVAQPEVVDVRGPVEPLEGVGPLVDHLHAHVGEDRQHLGERQRGTDAEDLQPGLAGRRAHLLVEREREPGVAVDLLETADVVGSRLRRVVLLVGLRPARGVSAHEAAALLLAVRRDDGGDEVVAPGPGRLGAATFEVGDVGLADLLAVAGADDEVQPCGERLAHVGGPLDRLTGELGLEDRGDALADAGVVAVPGEVDQAREEPAVEVAPHEELQLAPLAGVHHLRRDRDEVLHRRLEQLVARVGLEDVHQRLARMAARVEPDRLHHGVGLLAQDGDAAHRLGVGGRGEQPEEAPLPHDLTGLVELLHADVVEEHGPVHGRAGVGLGQHQQVLVSRTVGDQLRQHARGKRVRPQDAVAGPGHCDQHLLAVAPLEGVLAVAEEGEVVVGQPAQQPGALLDLLGRQRRRVLLDVLDEQVDLVVHAVPVLDRVAHVGEHLGQLVLDRVELLVGDPVDLEVHPRLADDVVTVGDGLVVEDLLHRAHHVAAHDVLRVDDEVDVVLALRQDHRDRVDEERHVIGDHLDDRVPACRPPVHRDARGEHLDRRLALGAVGREPQLRHHGAVEVRRLALEEVLRGDVAVEAAHHRRQVDPVRCLRVPGIGVTAQRRDELGFVLLQHAHDVDVMPVSALSQSNAPGAAHRLERSCQSSG